MKDLSDLICVYFEEKAIRDLHGPGGPASREQSRNWRGQSGPGSQTDKLERAGPGFLIQWAGPGFTGRYGPI